jgi:hypothetical protein
LTTNGWSPKLGGVDHAKHLDHALDPIEAAERGADLRQHDEASLPRGLSPLLHREILAELALAHPCGAGGVAGQEQELAGLHRIHEIGGWSGIRRQGDVQRLEARFRPGRRLS